MKNIKQIKQTSRHHLQKIHNQIASSIMRRSLIVQKLPTSNKMLTYKCTKRKIKALVVCRWETMVQFVLVKVSKTSGVQRSRSTYIISNQT